MKYFTFIVLFLLTIFFRNSQTTSAQDLLAISQKDRTDTLISYKQEEVSIQNGNIKLAGTLTLPLTKAPAPVIIMLTGSGQQNRDEELFGFKIFGIIADRLSKSGFAVLRCDDRGIGGSTGNFALATDEDFMSDALAAIDFIKSRPEINQTQIGLFGHSEGGIVAQMTAARSNDVAFIILMSAPGIPGDTLIKSQISWNLKASGASGETIKKQLSLQQKIYNAVRTDTGWDEVAAELQKPLEEAYDKLSESMKSKLPSKEVYLKKAVEKQFTLAKSPWFRHLIDFDPSSALEKIHCPVLLIFGGKDTQVPLELNKPAMQNALERAGNKNYLIKEFPDANHLYQQAVTGSPKEYPTLKKEFVQGFLESITDWLRKQYPRISGMQDYDKNSLIEIRK